MRKFNNEYFFQFFDIICISSDSFLFFQPTNYFQDGYEKEKESDVFGNAINSTEEEKESDIFGDAIVST